MKKLFLIWFALSLAVICSYQATAGRLTLIGAGGGGGCSQATTFLARVSSPSGSDITNYTNLICGLVTDGVWTKLDALWITAAKDRTTANLNLTSTSFTLVEHPTPGSSPAFVAFQGYTGVDGSSTIYLDTQFSPASSGTNFLTNTASFGLWSNTSRAASAQAFHGSSDTTFVNNNTLILRFSGDLTFFRINDASSSGSVSNTNTAGHFVATRSGASTQNGYINAVDKGVTPTSAGTLTTSNITLLGILHGPNHDDGDAVQVSAAHLGGSLSAGDVTALFTRIGTYRTAVGL